MPFYNACANLHSDTASLPRARCPVSPKVFLSLSSTQCWTWLGWVSFAKGQRAFCLLYSLKIRIKWMHFILKTTPSQFYYMGKPYIYHGPNGRSAFSPAGWWHWSQELTPCKSGVRLIFFKLAWFFPSLSSLINERVSLWEAGSFWCEHL